AREAPLRLALVRIGPQAHVFAFCAHHIAWDGASLAVFLGELVASYEMRLAGRAPALPPLAWQYADHAMSQRERLAHGVFQPSLDYWLATLRDAPAAIELPFDRSRPGAM